MQELFGSEIVPVSLTVVGSAPPTLEQTIIGEEDTDKETEGEKAAPVTEWGKGCWVRVLEPRA